MRIRISPETNKDHDAIFKLNKTAFGNDSQACMIKVLREHPLFFQELSLIAKSDEKTIGHIILFPVKLKENRQTSITIGPISVDPEYKNMGLENKLIKEGVKKVKEFGFGSVIATGNRSTFSELGFKPAKEWGITSNESTPDTLWAKELLKNALKECASILEYPVEFTQGHE